MSTNFCVPTNNTLNKNRSANSSSNKENRPSIHISMSNRVQGAQKNTFATPSEDDFDDDDDEFLIAASQQVERTLAREKTEVAAKATVTLQLQGEIAVLRDQNTKLTRERDQIHIKQLEDIKAQEMKFKRELDNIKSKLEFKDRDIEELKAKIQSDNRSDSYHLAKRPRLSVVKETRTAAAPATSQQTHEQFRIKNFRSPSSVAISTFCSLNLNEISTDVEHRNLVTFYKGLQNNVDLQKKFNIGSDGKCTPSKEVSSTMEHLFLQADILPSWHDKTICLKILSVLLTYNTYPNLEPEIKKLVAAALQSASVAQHSILTETLQHSAFNILLLCSRSSSGCQLNALYRHRSRHVIDMLISAVLQVSDTIHYCSCSNKMVMYTCDVIQDSVTGDLLSATVEIRDGITLRQCLQLLSSLSTYLPDMKLNSTTQTVFFGALDLLKKCYSLSKPGQAMVDLLYEAVFDANTSMCT